MQQLLDIDNAKRYHPTKNGQTVAAKRKKQLQDDKECGGEYERIVTTDGCLHDTIVACFGCGVDSKVACLIQGLHRKRGWWSKNSLSEAPAWSTLLGVAVSPTSGSPASSKNFDMSRNAGFARMSSPTRMLLAMPVSPCCCRSFGVVPAPKKLLWVTTSRGFLARQQLLNKFLV